MFINPKVSNRLLKTACGPGDIPITLMAAIPVSFILLFSSCITVGYAAEEPYYVTEYVTENHTRIFTEIVTITRKVPHEAGIQPYILWSNPQLVFNDHRSLWYYGYDLSDFAGRENTKIKISFFKQHFHEYLAVSVFDMHRKGQILSPPLISASDNIVAVSAENEWITSRLPVSTFDIWRTLANQKLDFAGFLGGSTDVFLNTVTPAPIVIDTHGCTEVAVLISGPTDPRNCRFNVSILWEEAIAENITRTVEHSVPVQVERKVPRQREVQQSRQVPFWEAFFNK